MKKWNYYNDSDPRTCAWVRELIRLKLVPDGEVDSRSIIEVRPEDLNGFIQAHFFCGVLGWPLALQLAGISSDTPLWTISCPCQPFSVAGKGGGVDDERHLWPEVRRLIATCEPVLIFGEQVASSAGREWLSLVRFDLENISLWKHYYQNLYLLLAASSVDELSKILREITRWTEAAVHGVPETVRKIMAGAQQGTDHGIEAQKGAQGEGISEELQHLESWKDVGDGGCQKKPQEGPAVRSVVASGRDRKASADGSLRDDGNRVRFSVNQHQVEKPIASSGGTEEGVCVPKPEGDLLLPECGNGQLGRGAAEGSVESLVTKECLKNERRISEIFGAVIKAQVGKRDLAGVRADLEALGYRVGAADLCAAGTGAPHIRQRLYWGAWLADAGVPRSLPAPQSGVRVGEEGAGPRDGQPERRDTAERMADADGRHPGDGDEQRGGIDRLRAEDRRPAGDARDHQRTEALGLADSDQQGPCGGLTRFGDHPVGRSGSGVRLAGPDVRPAAAEYRSDGGMGQPDRQGRITRESPGPSTRHGNPALPAGGAVRVVDPTSPRPHQQRGDSRTLPVPEGADAGEAPERAGASAGGLAYTAHAEGTRQPVQQQHIQRTPGGGAPASRPGTVLPLGDLPPGPGFWSDYDIVHCTDGRARRIEPSALPLDDGLSAGLGHGGSPEPAEEEGQAATEVEAPGFPLSVGSVARVARLKGYGNAIVPPLAAVFILSFLEAVEETAA